MRPMQLDGETDAADRTAVINHLIERHKIPKHLIKNNWFVTFSRWDGKQLNVTEDPGKDCPDIIRHPDIMVLSESGNVKYVIEIDGSIHGTKSGMKKTEQRNSDYDAGGVKCNILDSADLQVLGQTWQEHLDAQISRLAKQK